MSQSVAVRKIRETGLQEQFYHESPRVWEMIKKKTQESQKTIKIKSK